MILKTWLEWALVAISLFNTILLLWQGIMLWLNADRRSPGVMVAAGGFGLGSAFFVSHAALLLSESVYVAYSNTLWLAVAMIPVVLQPYVWYVVVLWYSGYWTEGDSRLHQRHRPWLWLVSATLLAGFACLVLLGTPFVPTLRPIVPFLWPARELIKTPILGIPLVALAFPLYVLLCVALSLEALRRPGVTSRLLGEAARQKARPWLVAATALLLAVGVLVATVVLWTITHTRMQGGYYLLTPDKLAVIGRFDLAISILIAAVTVLLGQAITAYELFTGKVLPRRALARQWKRAIWLAAGYGVLMGGALVWGLEPLYAILLTALLMTVFFALLSWRSYVDWEQAMRQLRPFVASQRWYDALVASPAGELPPPDPFRALCEDLLNTTIAHLIPVGPTAALIPSTSYPAGSETHCPSAGSLAQQTFEQARLIVAVDPDHYGGALWAVSLWRERGLIGVLLLGPRRDGGLYTEEEIEIARSTGERLIDLAASLALSQQLMQLQRERMAATQILDQRTRRMLHDEVLPLIHAAMLSLSADQPVDMVNQQLSNVHGQVSNLLRELPPSLMPELARLGLLGALRRAVNLEFAPAFNQVTWCCDEEAEAQAATLNPLAAETLYYAAREAVRNAARHARPAGSEQPLRLKIVARIADKQLQIEVEDDGAGLSREPGTGQGLALHSTLMAIVGGSLSLETVPGQMTRVQLAVPL
jgi:signal transduction histidine kinase